MLTSTSPVAAAASTGGSGVETNASGGASGSGVSPPTPPTSQAAAPTPLPIITNAVDAPPALAWESKFGVNKHKRAKLEDKKNFLSNGLLHMVDDFRVQFPASSVLQDNPSNGMHIVPLLPLLVVLSLDALLTCTPSAPCRGAEAVDAATNSHIRR